jgi:hypothetical protein
MIATRRDQFVPSPRRIVLCLYFTRDYVATTMWLAHDGGNPRVSRFATHEIPVRMKNEIMGLMQDGSVTNMAGESDVIGGSMLWNPRLKG